MKFTATLERASNTLNWTLVRVPPRVSAAFKKRGQVRVNGEISALRSGQFTTTLFPDGNGGHYFVVNRAMQKAAGVAAGAQAEFTIKAETKPRTVEMPAELERVLGESRRLRRWFDEKLTPSRQRELFKWAAQPKTSEGRRSRAEHIAEWLMQTMEGERELPPMLRIALERTPRAAKAWHTLSPERRRIHLLGILFPRSPEAQARRAAKALQGICAKACRD